MSELRVDSVKSKGGGAPNLPKGVTISGIATAVTLGATSIDVSNVNVSGVVTSGTLSGNLTGTPTLGLGVTINASGLHITGVATAGIVSATTLYGDGANVTGLAVSVSPWYYNPDVYDSSVTFDTGIGITFNQQILAGSGDITLRIAGAAGTVVENFGVGSSVTIGENRVSFTPSSNLSDDTVYYVSYPSGCFTDNIGNSYAGTAYTFSTRTYNYELWSWGYNGRGQLGLNNRTTYSSPVQIPGTTWTSGKIDGYYSGNWNFGIKTDGTLWSWGFNGNNGQLGQNNLTDYSSPTQIPGTTWSKGASLANGGGAIKTDGTLWIWGTDADGQLAQNTQDQHRSSPVQVPGTTWSLLTGSDHVSAIKTDGTLWAWGDNGKGELGQNNTAKYSSPVQIPGTTWSKIENGRKVSTAIKTDGTLWSWGYGYSGELGQNTAGTAYKSSPVQVGSDTTWSEVSGSMALVAAIKTDGTLWSWGYNTQGQLGINDRTQRSSPVQVPGTTWSKVAALKQSVVAVKTDGTLWAWGDNGDGELGANNRTYRSSPVQVPGTTWDFPMPTGGGGGQSGALVTKRL